MLVCVLALPCGFRGGVLAPLMADGHSLCSSVALLSLWRFLEPLIADGHSLCSSVALLVLRRRSCAADSCGSSRVAASGGQGGIGGLRVPPTPSLDSLLTPLYRRRSAEGLEAARRGVLARHFAAGAKVRRGELRSSSAALSCASKLFGPFFSQNQFERALRPSRIDFGELAKRTAQTARVRLPVYLSARPAARPL